MADTDFITRHDAQVEYCKLCGVCKTPGKKENVENACIQSFPAKNPILEIPVAQAIPATEEAAVKFLTESGWMEKHDKEIRADDRRVMERWEEDARLGKIQGAW